jgi:hypothetical protein
MGNAGQDFEKKIQHYELMDRLNRIEESQFYALRLKQTEPIIILLRMCFSPMKESKATLLTNRKAPTVKEEERMCKPAGAFLLKRYFNQNNFTYVRPIKEQIFFIGGTADREKKKLSSHPP